MAFKLLVVEDEKDISDIIVKYLEKEGYAYQVAVDGFQALEYFAAQAFQMVILDIMMPGIDGFKVLEAIRAQSEVPVILLTAREQEADRLQGFDLGADDYVTKPFSPRELIRRIKALQKRVYKTSGDQILTFGPLKLNTASEKLTKNDVEIPLTHTEFLLLLTLMTHPGIILTREQLMDLAMGSDYDGIDRNVDSHVKRLRQKIEDDAHNPRLIRTRYGAGYLFGGDES